MRLCVNSPQTHVGGCVADSGPDGEGGGGDKCDVRVLLLDRVEAEMDGCID